MRKSKLGILCLIIIISLSILFFINNTVYAETTLQDFNSLTGTTSGGSTSNSTNGFQSITGSGTSTETTGSTTTENSTQNIVFTTTNTSNYNNSLPKTGLDNSNTGIALIVLLVISAIYAYKKIQYYKNV